MEQEQTENEEIIEIENPLEDVIFNRIGNVFKFDFPKKNIRIRLDKISQDRYTGADVRVEYLKPLQFQAHHIFQSKANIDQSSGANGKTSMVKTCYNRADDLNYEEWDAIIEYSCVSVLEAFREDETAPAINLRDLAEATDEGMLVTPLFPANEPSIIFGEGGTGKSVITLWLAGLVSEGFGFDWVSAKKKNVLYLDYETSEAEFKRRGDKLSKGMGLDMPYANIWYRRYNSPLVDMVEHLREEIDRNDIGFIVVDSVGYACPEPISDKETNKYFNAMRTFPEVTFINIAHTSKENIAKKTPFGSVFWWNGARSINNGSLQKPIGFNLKFLPDSIMINNADAKEIQNYEVARTRTDEIYQILARSSEKLNLNEILYALELDESKLNSVRASMSRNDNMIHFGNGLWGVKGKNYGNNASSISW